MRHPKMLITAIALILVGLSGLVFVFLLGGPASPRGGGSDAMFIERMIPHHDDAIAMAELALERSQRPEIRQLAEDIRRSQTAENAQMRRWYRDWCGDDLSEFTGRMGMMGGRMQSMTDLRALESADDFDREFLEQMIPHHEMAVMMTSMHRGGRQELAELKDAMRSQQSREIELMEAWYRDWYGR